MDSRPILSIDCRCGASRREGVARPEAAVVRLARPDAAVALCCEAFCRWGVEPWWRRPNRDDGASRAPAPCITPRRSGPQVQGGLGVICGPGCDELGGCPLPTQSGGRMAAVGKPPPAYCTDPRPSAHPGHLRPRHDRAAHLACGGGRRPCPPFCCRSGSTRRCRSVPGGWCGARERAPGARLDPTIPTGIVAAFRFCMRNARAGGVGRVKSCPRALDPGARHDDEGTRRAPIAAVIIGRRLTFGQGLGLALMTPLMVAELLGIPLEPNGDEP
jgi:hypothetical protein